MTVKISHFKIHISFSSERKRKTKKEEIWESPISIHLWKEQVSVQKQTALYGCKRESVLRWEMRSKFMLDSHLPEETIRVNQTAGQRGKNNLGANCHKILLLKWAWSPDTLPSHHLSITTYLHSLWTCKISNGLFSNSCILICDTQNVQPSLVLHLSLCYKHSFTCFSSFISL